MVSGSVWYTTQAYRALNQALGRCLRHRNDWGALVLVDERFERAGGDRKNISSWIGERMRPFKNFRTFERDLGNFVKKMSQH
jgi:Fanconi anemia group J protein